MNRHDREQAAADAPLVSVARALEEHPAIRHAVVCWRATGDEAQVVAYIVAEGAEPPPGELRMQLRDRVAPHLIPAVFVPVESVPVTAVGEIDWEALPAPNPAWAALERHYVAPTTPLEAALAEIWGDVLLLDRVGIHDDFLEHNGDSLLAAQIVARIYERFGVQIPLEWLFERGTIAELVDEFFADAPRNRAD